ncbi:DUF2127 domain-containing protein [Nakamurella flavida]|uniref:DUF2127 domain-containing protein n=1 Tax=Nakamurella flavida TaxID=363630 RepID=A0A938YQJ8_9ACTN|nr:DUF2127 domain-containing protein [Nakamurella flavida]MBM9477413.1 DUF2127 domain-containing protein [Nakamurella flavida]MDP9777346.1 uncharacterized membrane protein (DUF2068 family) [Nakamurella flavida]
MDWNLRSCGVRGHATYAPDEPGLAARLRVDTPIGEAWRCLRCGDFVPGEPHGSGPADDAPEVPRGKLLRDRTIMRVLAVERVFRGLVVLGIVYLILRFRGSRESVQQAFDTDLSLFRPLADQIGWNVESSSLVSGIDRFLGWSPTALTWLAVALGAYAVIEFAEAYGLWMMRRWGEYLAVVATGLFLPIEIREILERVTWLRILLFAINLAAVLWLLWSKRLFGIRGGGAAWRAEHHAESLLSVERAAAGTDVAPARR